MTTYKGILLRNDRDYIDVARELDIEFADALGGYLYDTSLLLEELDDYEKKVCELISTDEQAKIKELQDLLSKQAVIIADLKDEIDTLKKPVPQTDIQLELSFEEELPF